MTRILMAALTGLLAIIQVNGAAAEQSAGRGAAVEQFTPTGLVRDVRRVYVRFATAMVEFGDPTDRTDPFIHGCAEMGRGRWLDPRKWVFEFDRDFPRGRRCAFSLREGLRDLAGQALAARQTYEFMTRGATVRRISPWDGSGSLESDQVFVLYLDAPADRDSVRRLAYFDVAGIGNPVEPVFLTEEEAAPLLREYGLRRDWEEGRTLIFRPRLTLPESADVRFVWHKDIVTPGGAPTGNAENRIFKYRVQDPFSLTLACRRKDETEGCDPLGDVRMRFSSYLDANLAEQITMTGPDGEARSGDVRGSSATRHILFEGPFQPNAAYQFTLPEDLRDQQGRKLDNFQSAAMVLETGDYPPLAKFSGRFGILELEDSPVLPVTVRNLERTASAGGIVSKTAEYGIGHWLQEAANSLAGTSIRLAPDREGDASGHRQKIISMMQRLDGRHEYDSSWLGEQAAGADQSARTSFKLPAARGRNETEVVGLPLEEPGFYLVEIASRNLAEAFRRDPARPETMTREKMYVRTGALVTNMSVHLKKGRENSLVWVTQLNDASPVEGADVHILDCDGRPVATGRTNGDGVAQLQKALPAEAPYCKGGYSRYHQGYFVFAEKAEDVSFVHTSWNDGIEKWRFGGTHNYSNRHLPVLGRTVLDRGLYRAGETVHMKHFLRRHGGTGISRVEGQDDWKILDVVHQGTDKRHRFQLDWDSHGTAVTDMDLSEAAKLGTYRMFLKKNGDMSDWDALSMGKFMVQEFKIPLAKAAVGVPGERLIGVREVPLDLSVHYLAGGGAADLPVSLRTEMRRSAAVFRSKSLPEFAFNRGRASDAGKTDRLAVRQWDFNLGPDGTLRHMLTDIPKTDSRISILAELAYRDPNGETRTRARRITIHPSQWNIGIKAARWLTGGENPVYQVALRDLDDRPIAGGKVTLTVTARQTLTHRKKLAGGIYGYEHESTESDLGQICAGETDAQGLFECAWETDRSGQLIAQASVEAPEGVRLATHAVTWRSGEDYWRFEAEATDRMDLLLEKAEYEPGDTARLQVRMPFMQATGLVTVEREGVLDYQLVDLEGRSPVVELPLDGIYAPNVFVSVLAVRGRADGVRPTAMVDLGRPSFRLGQAEIKVGWDRHRLNVGVEPGQAAYRIREKARAVIRVEAADGKPLPAGAVAAVAVVDEGLLSLADNKSWNLLSGMMGLRNHEVGTYTAQMQVVGKRHFGQKAVPDGGGGGAQTARTLFDTLLYWNPRVPVDRDGHASVEFALNDALTRYRVVAVVSAGGDRFGTGHSSFRATKDLLVFPGLPPFAREGDRVTAGYNLRNSTEKPMVLQARLAVEGLNTDLPVRPLSLQPGEAREVSWTLEIPHNIRTLTYRMTSLQDGQVADIVETEQSVKPAVPVRTIQSLFRQLEQPLNVSVKRPAAALEGRGGLNVVLDRSVAVSLEGVRDYMEEYPWRCFEQQSSRAVSLDERGDWDRLMAKMDSYQDENGLLRYFPDGHRGSVILSSYILSLSKDKGWPVPAEGLNRILDGLAGFVNGHITVRSYFGERTLHLRKLKAIEALSRYGRARASMLDSLRLDPGLLPTPALLNWFSILRRVKDIPNREELLADSDRLLRARIRFDGPVMRFVNGERDDMWYFMADRNVNASRIVLSLLEFDEWREDIPGLMKGAIARQRNGHWGMSTANAVGTVAVERFVERFEADEITGSTRMNLADTRREHAWTADEKQAVAMLPWPKDGAAELSVDHTGGGKPWLSVRSRAALPLSEPLNAGYGITRNAEVVRRKKEGQLSVGDVIKVELEIEAFADATWVAVADPVPPGAVILGKGLKGGPESVDDGAGGNSWWIAYQEKAFDGMTTYYRYMPEGRHKLSYSYVVNTPGVFRLPDTRVEAMYQPELHGYLPNEPLEIVR